MAAIYLDTSASTPVLPEVWEAMKPYALEAGNASSAHHFGRRARRALEDAREQIAELLDAQPEQVLFTSGATEANNLAILGLVNAERGSILTTSVEHPSVLEPVRFLTRYHHVQLPVTRSGSVDVEAIEIPDDVRLVSVMLANHETGALQPVRALLDRVGRRAPFHCDAAAAAGKMPISFRELSVDTLTLSAHKFHGPAGIGALLIREPARLKPLFHGGHQQGGRRPGTEPVDLAVGMARALTWCEEHREENWRHVTQLRNLLLDELNRYAAPVKINSPTNGLPHVLNIAFPGCKADQLMMKLDLAGVACSAGSACSSGSMLPSHVLSAMGLAKIDLLSSLRFSFSSLLDEEDLKQAARIISLSVKELRLSDDTEA